MSHVPLACPFRVLDDGQTAAVSTRRGRKSRQLCRPSPSLRRLPLISNRGIWSCTKLRREPEWTPWERSWTEKTLRFWPLGALRGLLRLGQCLRHVLGTVIDHCIPRRFSSATFAGCVSRRLICSFKGTTSMRAREEVRAFTGLLMGLEPSWLGNWDRVVLVADACSHWRVTLGAWPTEEVPRCGRERGQWRFRQSDVAKPESTSAVDKRDCCCFDLDFGEAPANLLSYRRWRAGGRDSYRNPESIETLEARV